MTYFHLKNGKSHIRGWTLGWLGSLNQKIKTQQKFSPVLRVVLFFGMFTYFIYPNVLWWVGQKTNHLPPLFTRSYNYCCCNIITISVITYFDSPRKQRFLKNFAAHVLSLQFLESLNKERHKMQNTWNWGKCIVMISYCILFPQNISFLVFCQCSHKNNDKAFLLMESIDTMKYP